LLYKQSNFSSVEMNMKRCKINYKNQYLFFHLIKISQLVKIKENIYIKKLCSSCLFFFLFFSMTTRKSTNTDRITDDFFYRYFAMIFTDWIYSIANPVSIYRWKHSISIYRGNPSWNIKNFKKQSSVMTYKFLWMTLPTKLQWDSILDVRRWRVYCTHKIVNRLTDEIILSVIPWVIFNIWPGHRPSPPLFLLLLPLYI
jgi:hypothetical protein